MFFLAFPTKTQAEGNVTIASRQKTSAKSTETVEQRSEYWM